jgi:hypothetical protein
MGAERAKTVRAKLSTTVAPETFEFLARKVESGEAASLAEAIDATVARIRRLENRRRLAVATAAYFDELDPQAAAEENTLAESLASALSGIDFDQEV